MAAVLRGLYQRDDRGRYLAGVGVGMEVGRMTPFSHMKLPHDKGIFSAACDAHDLPYPECEYRFAPPRRWRFDYAWPDRKVALEVDGGVYTRGRHVRSTGRVNDMEKFSTAASLHWLVIYVTPDQVYEDRTFDWLRGALRRHSSDDL